MYFSRKKYLEYNAHIFSFTVNASERSVKYAKKRLYVIIRYSCISNWLERSKEEIMHFEWKVFIFKWKHFLPNISSSSILFNYSYYLSSFTLLSGYSVKTREISNEYFFFEEIYSIHYFALVSRTHCEPSVVCFNWIWNRNLSYAICPCQRQPRKGYFWNKWLVRNHALLLMWEREYLSSIQNRCNPTLKFFICK